MSSEFYRFQMRDGKDAWVNPRLVEAVIEASEPDCCHVQFVSGASMFINEDAEDVSNTLAGAFDDECEDDHCYWE